MSGTKPRDDMPHSSTPPRWARSRSDYQLIGGAGERAAAEQLVNASWYKCPVPRPMMKTLMQREDTRAARDTVLWYALIVLLGALFAYGWHAGWRYGALLLAYLAYTAVYSGAADSRWHECSHGTAFKTRWMNTWLYQCASFQVLRRPTKWRWSHARHHTDTLVTGRDPEVAAPVPIDVIGMLLNLLGLKSGPKELWAVLCNALGRIAPEEKTFVPEMEWPKMVREARYWLLAYAVIAACAWAMGSVLPLLLLGPVPGMAGAWAYTFFGLTQHAGLPENVLDHRLNCRTVHMNPVFRFLYWNMNYHVEHHMFPMVPYHALPLLHDAVAHDCAPAYASTWHAYAEILPALARQIADPQYYVKRSLPGSAEI